MRIGSAFSLKEMWLIEQKRHKLNNMHSEYLSYNKSSVDIMSEIIVSRPSGSMATLYSKSLAKYVRDIDTNSRQICRITIKTEFLCVYFISLYYSNMTVNDDYVNIIVDIEYYYLRRFQCMLRVWGNA